MKITFTQVFFNNYVQVEGHDRNYHSWCYPMVIKEMNEKKVSKDFQESVLKNQKMIIELLNLVLKTETLNNEYLQEILAFIEVIDDYSKKNIQETSKILIWLELKAAQKEDAQKDIGIFDPLLLEMLKKYSGLEWKELARMIKNKGMKNIINQMHKEEQNKK